MHIYINVKLDIPLKIDLGFLKYETNKLQGNYLTCRTTTGNYLNSFMKVLIQAEARHKPWLSLCVQFLSSCLKESCTEARSHIGSSATKTLVKTQIRQIKIKWFHVMSWVLYCNADCGYGAAGTTVSIPVCCKLNKIPIISFITGLRFCAQYSAINIVYRLDFLTSRICRL